MLPNSPRDRALGERVLNVPIQTDIASKSKVRHTEIFLAIAASSRSVERRVDPVAPSVLPR
jgi:hypothetical protein